MENLDAGKFVPAPHFSHLSWFDCTELNAWAVPITTAQSLAFLSLLQKDERGELFVNEDFWLDSRQLGLSFGILCSALFILEKKNLVGARLAMTFPTFCLNIFHHFAWNFFRLRTSDLSQGSSGLNSDFCGVRSDSLASLAVWSFLSSFSSALDWVSVGKHIIHRYGFLSLSRSFISSLSFSLRPSNVSLWIIKTSVED